VKGKTIESPLAGATPPTQLSPVLQSQSAVAKHSEPSQVTVLAANTFCPDPIQTKPTAKTASSNFTYILENFIIYPFVCFCCSSDIYYRSMM
jgi:hypothetical protein